MMNAEHPLTRSKVASAVKALREYEPKSIAVSGIKHEQGNDCAHYSTQCTNTLTNMPPTALGEGSHLASFEYQACRVASYKARTTPVITPLLGQSNAIPSTAFQTGVVYAQSQNMARQLMETPSNHLTPQLFAEQVQAQFKGLPVDIHVRDVDWIKEKNMGGLLAVSKGSAEKPVFLELHYRGRQDSSAGKGPIVYVGKGVTFDSGGISIKPSQGMGEMKGDMGGAATVVSAVHGIASLKLNVDVLCFVPLCENMPSGNALKPGDVIFASNGKSIEVCVSLFSFFKVSSDIKAGRQH
jgi:aminopeptidase